MTDLFRATHCDRCGKEFKSGESRIMSKMNTDIICMNCKEEEKEHPRYKDACEAEIEAVKSGIRNYGGMFENQKYPFK